MPIKLKCRCGEKLSAPDSAAGKKGKCPKCGMRFMVPTIGVATAGTSQPAAAKPRPTTPSTSLAPDLDDLPDIEDEIGLMEEEPVVPSRSAAPAPSLVEVKRKAEEVRALRASLEKAGRGVTLVLWGTLGAFLSFVILPFAAYLHHLGGPLPSYWLAVLVKVGLCVSWGLSIAGHCVCAWTARQGSARGLLLFAVGLDIAAMVVAVLALLRVVAMLPTFGVSGICLFLGGLAFLFFLRGLVPLLRRDDLLKDIKISMIALALCVAASAISYVVPALGALVFLLVAPWGMYKYLHLQQHVAQTLRA